MDGWVAKPSTVTVEAQSDQTRQYTFIDDNGSCYIAVWNDGEAGIVSKDTVCRITVNGMQAITAEAWDPFTSLKQSLMIDTSNGSTVLDGILLKDYPIIIKIDRKSVV